MRRQEDWQEFAFPESFACRTLQRGMQVMERTTLHALPKARPVDAVKELRLRQWARTNFVVAEKRPRLWHPIVLDEMSRIDDEQQESLNPTTKIYAWDGPSVHRPHEEAWNRALKMTRYEPMNGLDLGLPTELFFG